VKLPRDLSGTQLARKLEQFGYRISRQTGSHIRLTTLEYGEHHVTIPAHHSLKVGTLATILAEVANHFGISREDLFNRLFG